jgi:hypothetical protein
MIAILLVVGAAVLSVTVGRNLAVDRPQWIGMAPAALAAPAAIEVGELSFSESVDDRARPRDPKIEFDSTSDDVWVSFDYRNNSGSNVSYLARANGEDWAWGDLDCCEGSQGRYAFPLRRRSGKDLGGAAYEVFIYDGDTEKARGGFGVHGTKGFDSDGQGNSNNNGNDNH